MDYRERILKKFNKIGNDCQGMLRAEEFKTFIASLPSEKEIVIKGILNYETGRQERTKSIGLHPNIKFILVWIDKEII